MWNLRDTDDELPAWIIDRLPAAPTPSHPMLELPLPVWTEPPTDDEEQPRGSGGTVIVIDL